MAVLRTEITTALDEIVSNEEGMRFQGLSVTLAKKKWPQLIARERHKDEGLDAHAPAVLMSDGAGVGLACSITEGFGKINGDATSAKANFPGLKVLIYATPHAVGNPTQKKWQKDILDAHGLELVLVTREDFIATLMMPENAGICAAQLRIPIQLEQGAQDKLAAAIDASTLAASGWARRSLAAGAPLIPLVAIALKRDGSDGDTDLAPSDIQQALDEGRRLILEGAAGQGKTTLLTHLAGERLKAGKLALLVDLPDWIRSQKSILEYIAQAPQFIARAISAADLAKLSESTQLTFCLNGWNEISEALSDSGVQALAGLERDFPEASIILATRAHNIAPPLPGARRMRLRRITSTQRADYIAKRIGAAGDALREQIEGSRVLHDLTLTPLFLSEVVELQILGKPVPETRSGILRAILDAMDHLPQHQAALAAKPLFGQAREYLAGIAGAMTSTYGTRLDEGEARKAVSEIAGELCHRQLIGELPEQALILSALAAHHCLERVDYPSSSYRFGHQQFQEYLASEHLAAKFTAYISAPTAEARTELLASYVNKPVWAEAFRMLFERLAAESQDGAQADAAIATATEILRMALSVDPIFASELAFIAGDFIWPKVKAEFGHTLRGWFAMESHHHKECAVEAMLATGSDDFADILTPIYADPKSNFRTYQDGHFHVSSFGPGWRELVQSWGEEARSSFLMDAIDSGELGDELFELIQAEPAAPVRAKMTEQYTFRASEAACAAAFQKLDDEALTLIIDHLPADYVPFSSRERGIKLLRALAKAERKPMQNVHTLRQALNLGDATAMDAIKAELGKLSKEELADNYHQLFETITAIAEADRPWAEGWVTERLKAGTLWSAHWKDFVAPIDAEDRGKLLAEYEAADRNLRWDPTAVALLTAKADAPFAETTFVELCRLRGEMGWRPGADKREISEAYSRVEAVLRAMPKKPLIDAILNRAKTGFNETEYREALGLIGGIGREPNTIPKELDAETLAAIRTYFKGGLDFVLADPDYGGSLKSEYTLAIARVGTVEDLADIERIIWADIARHSAGIAEIRKGHHNDQVNGARTCWVSWHMHALETLEAPGTDELLVRLLDDDYYRQDAAGTLLRRARLPVTSPEWSSGKLNPSLVWAARAGAPSSYDAAKLIAAVAAIKAQMASLTAQQAKSDKPETFAGPLRGLARLLAVSDPKASAPDVIRLTVFFKYDGWNSVAAMKYLIEGGAMVSTGELHQVLGPVLDGIEKEGFWNDQNTSLYMGALCLFTFASDPEKGISYISDALQRSKVHTYQLRDLIECLGESQCDAAAKFILGLKDADGTNHLVQEWIDALCALDTPTARAALLSMVDPAADELKLANGRAHHTDALVAYLARLANADREVKEKIFAFAKAAGAGPKRGLLIDVLAIMGTTDSLILGLDLSTDENGGVMTYKLFKGIEEFVVEHVPIEGARGSFRMRPRDGNVLRRHLLQMAAQDKRHSARATDILGQIEVSRQRWGRPKGEDRHPGLDLGIDWPVIPKIVG